MMKEILLLFVILFSPIKNYFYIRYNSMIYSISIQISSVSTDFTSMFPLNLSLSNSISPDYYIIGRSLFIYEPTMFTSRYTYITGDIALLKDNTYVIFKKTTPFESSSVYIGSIQDFDNILENINDEIDNFDTNTNMMFESGNLCSPYILPINGENEISVKLDRGYSYYYGIVNFATRGTSTLTKVPPIYLNNLYLGDDCEIESDGYSIKCTIGEKWYDKKSSNKYKVNELYEGCYGPIFTGIILTVSSEKISINLYLLLLIYLLYI